jgi:hypothetical protein
MLEAGTVLRNKYGKLVSLGVDSDHLEKNWEPTDHPSIKYRYPTFPNTVRITLGYEQATLEFQAFIPGGSPIVSYLLNSNDFLYNPNVSLSQTVYQWANDDSFQSFDVIIYDKKFRLCSISSLV